VRPELLLDPDELVALLFNAFMVLIAIASIVATVPRTGHPARRGARVTAH
jgi:hypothetical protein